MIDRCLGPPWRWLLLVLVPVAVGLVCVPRARASFSGRDGEIAFETFSSSAASPGAPFTAIDSVQTTSRTLASCAGAGALPCTLGSPSYSPFGALVVMARQRPSDPETGTGSDGQLQLVDANGSDRRLLPRQTADDEQPAFDSDGEIVFTGRTRSGGTPNLYEVSATGRGRRQLTFGSGAQAAPCGSGAIAFTRDGNLFLLGSHGGVSRLTYSGGSEPSCAPDSRQIAYIHAGRLYEISIDGRDARQISPLAAQSPSFAPDGSQIAFVHPQASAEQGLEHELVIVDQAGREMQPPSPLATTDLPSGSAAQLRGHVTGLAWQPTLQRETAIHAAPSVPVFSGQAVVQVSAGANEGVLAARNRSGAVTLFAVRRSSRPEILPKLQRFKTLAGDAIRVAVSPYDRRLAVADADGTVSVYTISDQERVTLLAQRQVGQVSALRFSTNADLLAVATTGSTLQTLSVGSLARAGQATLSAPASTLAFSDFSTQLAVNGPNGVTLFAVGRSGALSQPQSPFTGPSMAFGFTGADELISWQADPAGLFELSAHSAQPRLLPGAPPLPAEQFMGMTTTISAAWDGYLRVFAGIDATDRTVQLATVSPNVAAVRQGVLTTGAASLGFSDNGNLLAVGDLDGRLSLFWFGPLPRSPVTS